MTYIFYLSDDLHIVKWIVKSFIRWPTHLTHLNNHQYLLMPLYYGLWTQMQHLSSLGGGGLRWRTFGVIANYALQPLAICNLKVWEPLLDFRNFYMTYSLPINRNYQIKTLCTGVKHVFHVQIKDVCVNLIKKIKFDTLKILCFLYIVLPQISKSVRYLSDGVS